MKAGFHIVACLMLSFFLKAQQPVNVIFDTDMGPDYDDVGAMAVLHALADSGRANILATIASTKYEGVGPVLEILNTYFGRSLIPIGVPRGKALELRDWQHWSDSLRAKYPHERKTNDQFSDAIDLYRQVLAAQPDNSVTIITVGFLTNLSALLKSSADRHSPLSGSKLVQRKVKKLVSMAGKFPSGLEFNIEEDAASAKHVFENWEGEVLFSGFEIGEKIKSGLALVRDSTIHNSPVKDVFGICIPMAEEDSAGRSSWDQTAVLIGVLGHKRYYSLRRGRIVIDEKGNNTWDPRRGMQYYLMEKADPEKVEALINRLMAHRPKE